MNDTSIMLSFLYPQNSYLHCCLFLPPLASKSCLKGSSISFNNFETVLIQAMDARTTCPDYILAVFCSLRSPCKSFPWCLLFPLSFLQSKSFFYKNTCLLPLWRILGSRSDAFTSPLTAGRHGSMHCLFKQP